jgi:hypothetical protein
MLPDSDPVRHRIEVAQQRPEPPEPAPPGHVWVLDSGMWRLIRHGDVERERRELAQHEAQQAAEQAARQAHREAEEAAAARAAAIKARVTPILTASDGQTDRQLGIGSSLPPARRALLRCHGQITKAGEAHKAALARWNEYQDLEARHAAARLELERFEVEVREAFNQHHSYGATSDAKPNPRADERAALQQRVEAAQWELQLASAAAGGLQADAAGAVVTTLQDRLPALRHAVMVECALPLTLEINDLCEQLAGRYRSMVGLAVVTGSLPKVAKLTLPPTPHGTPAFAIGAADVADQIVTWRAALAALEADARATIDVPGLPADGPTDAPEAGCWGRVRRAWREARG